MTEEMKTKLSNFLDSLIENKLDLIEIDIWTEKAKKHTFYSLDIDTYNTSKLNVVFTFNLHFAVCPQTGLVLLSKEEHEEFRINDIDFADKWSNKLKITQEKILLRNLDLIIESSCKELKLNRDENIKKLIG